MLSFSSGYFSLIYYTSTIEQFSGLFAHPFASLQHEDGGERVNRYIQAITIRTILSIKDGPEAISVTTGTENVSNADHCTWFGPPYTGSSPSYNLSSIRSLSAF